MLQLIRLLIRARKYRYHLDPLKIRVMLTVTQSEVLRLTAIRIIIQMTVRILTGTRVLIPAAVASPRVSSRTQYAGLFGYIAVMMFLVAIILGV